MCPFHTARAVPEVNEVVGIFIEESSKILYYSCYGSRLKELSQEATLVLSNTRELDRVPKTK